ncbi:hypothetical protein PP340_gp26 [Arthrobacter phage Adaia]|uniref:Uncharacterized protein n=1 Tax=Arthrobacter phage Adaia TaxID=2419945 RepID=A0A3G2KCX2_9CAUD|nr:hypothetical protein PP340_gp26 [Arthrobacter phage Adaia]AYN56813.1 hypothetical protein PBI_ADAIA_26 [Arthrobacter phage Adaia]
MLTGSNATPQSGGGYALQESIQPARAIGQTGTTSPIFESAENAT